MSNAQSILKHLVKIPSTTGNHRHNKRAIEYIDGFMAARGMFVKRYTFNGVESLVATTRDTKTPKVMLVGHVDVVPAPTELYTLREEEGKLIGRGVLDMKGAIASYLQLVDDLRYSLGEYDFGVMIVTDEEIGGFNGADRLVNEEGYLPEMCIIPDGGRNWALETFTKGIWLLHLTTQGVSAHGSRPWEGESAIDKLMELVDQVRGLFPQQNHDTSTCTVSLLEAGEAINQIAANASVGMDIRFASIEDEKNIRAAIDVLCEKYGATITTKVYAAPTVNDPEEPHLKSFVESAKKVLGYDPGTVVSLAGSDGRFFSAKGIPCAIFYPEGGGHHSSGEWITARSLEQMQMIIQDYLHKEARTPQKNTAQVLTVGAK